MFPKKILTMKIFSWFRSLFEVWRREFRLVFTDAGVMLFFFALPLVYPLVYTIIYNPEIVTDIPIVVVDHARTADSRQLARMFDDTQSIKVAGYAADLEDARRAMREKKCYGILEIPSDYSKRLGNGDQAVVAFYDEMSLLLRYRAFMSAMTDIQIELGQQITMQRVSAGGLLTSDLAASGMPVKNEAFFLGDPTQGFASFIMPGIVVLILQQSMILGIAMLAGNAAERRRRNRGYDPLAVDASPVTTVLGRTLCYVIIYIPMSYYILTMVPAIFALPHVGSVADYMPFIFAMLVASAMLGQSIAVFITERETSMLVIVFTSVFFLFLSGLTWPRYAMNPFWTAIADCIPATWGVEGIIRILANGADISEVSRYYVNEWILAAVYFVTAVILTRFLSPRLAKTTPPAKNA